MNKEEEKQFRCFRCQELLYESELKPGKGQASRWEYCDHCYDHMFVSWNDVWKQN